MADTLLDYSKQNPYLPEALRAFVGATDRMSKQDYTQFITMFNGVEQQAIFNNKTAAEFASGFTDLNYRYLRSGAAPRLKKIVVDKTVGRVYYQSEVDEKVLQEKFDKDYFSDVLYKAFDETAQTGRSLCVVYGDKEHPELVNITSYNLFRHRVIYDNKKNIKEAWLYIVDLKGTKVGFEYVICEHRYYNTIGEPMQVFELYGVTYENSNKKDARTRVLADNEIDQNIIDTYQIDFNKPKKLDMSTIGVYDIVYTKTNSKFIDVDIPEAMFVDAVDNAMALDTSITDKEVEKEVGRGQLLIPEFGMGSDIGQYQTQASAGSRMLRTVTRTYRNPVIMPYPTRSMEDSKPTSVQFDIRSDQWNAQIDNDTARLCASVGVGIIDYDPRLLQTGQRTDDEINAMTDITIQTVTTFRNINERKVNALLGCVCELLDIPQPVAIRWSMAAILNPTKNTELVSKQLERGLISRKEALKRLNPDYTDNEIEQLLNEINNEIENTTITTAFSNF